VTIRHLSYAACNWCGDPAQPGDNAEDARAIARREGWKRVRKQDICPRHITWSPDRKTWWLRPWPSTDPPTEGAAT
jgi:hypothetical protein